MGKGKPKPATVSPAASVGAEELLRAVRGKRIIVGVTGGLAPR